MYQDVRYDVNNASLLAKTPDQLLPYVQAVSEVTSFLMGNYVVHHKDGHYIIVGYSLQEHDNTQDLEHVIAHISQLPQAEHITLLAEKKPQVSLQNTAVNFTEDAYYFVDLPHDITLCKNAYYMCQKTNKCIFIQKEYGEKAWTSEHQELMLQYICRPTVSKEMGSIFQRIGMYCKQVPHACVFSAYDVDSNTLQAFSIADFTSLSTAFYMFAMRAPKAQAGVADALLQALLLEALERGYASCNLGLGINNGIRFFKEKWGAKPTLPLVQSSWNIGKNKQETKKTSWFNRLFTSRCI